MGEEEEEDFLEVVEAEDGEGREEEEEEEEEAVGLDSCSLMMTTLILPSMSEGTVRIVFSLSRFHYLLLCCVEIYRGRLDAVSSN